MIYSPANAPLSYVLENDPRERPLGRGKSWKQALRHARWNLVRRHQLVGLGVKRWVPLKLERESPLTCAACEPYCYGSRRGNLHARCRDFACECYCNRG